MVFHKCLFCTDEPQIKKNMMTRNKRSIVEEPGLQVSRSKRKTGYGYAGSTNDKKTLLSNNQPGHGVSKKKNLSSKSCVTLNVPSPQISRTRKRKSETVAVNIDKKLKLSQKKQKEDKKTKENKTFCWVCYKPCQTQICACKRVYHSDCLIKASIVFDGNICPECQLKSVDGTELTRPFPEGLKTYLECAANWIMEKYKDEMFMSWPQNPGNNKIVPPIDIKTLIKKVQNNAYKSTSEFYSDAKWIHHSTCILYGEKSKEAVESKKLVKDVKEELIDMEACPECYFYLYCKLFNNIEDSDVDIEIMKNFSYEKSFVRLCNPPHDIVWAKVSGYSHWPAKCLKVINGKAHVRFFGKHEKSDIPINTLFHMSERHPIYEYRNISNKENCTSLEYTYARKEFLRYKALYEKYIGEFKYFGFRQLYNTENDNFPTEKNLEHQKEITQGINQLELPSDTNSTSESCTIIKKAAVAVEHPQITLPSSFSNDISVSMDFSVDGCGPNESDGNSGTISANVESPTNFSETNFSDSNLNCSSISTGPSSEMQVKQEFCDLEQTLPITSVTEASSQFMQQPIISVTEASIETSSQFMQQQISSVTEPCNEASSQFMQILKNALSNPSESFDFRRNSHTSDLLASVLQKCISTTSTDETSFPAMIVPNISVVKEEHNLNSTDNVSSPSPRHELEEDTTANVTECSTVNSDQQDSECGTPCSSNNEVAVIDLTSDDDDIDSSTMALSNILRENPQMCGLFQHAHQTLHALLTRLCVETCKQQRADSQRRCEAFNNKLNETEKRFQEETEKLRDEIKCLQKSLATEKKRNTKS